MRRKNGFTLIELLAVIVVLAIIALIVTPIVSDIITSSKKAANARSVEGHIKDVQIAIMSKVFASDHSDMSVYDVTDGALKDGLEVSQEERVQCEKYTIKDGTVKKALGCRVDGNPEVYDYFENEGAKESDGTIPDEILEECSGCVYALDKIDTASEGTKVRPDEKTYLKYELENNEIKSGVLPKVCAYVQTKGEICLDNTKPTENVELSKTFFGYNTDWVYNSNTGLYDSPNGKAHYEFNDNGTYTDTHFYGFGISINLDSRGPVSIYDNETLFSCTLTNEAASCGTD